MESSNGFDFDQELERELKQRAAAHQGTTPPPAAARYHAAFLSSGGSHMPFLPQFAAGLSAKAAIGLAVAAAAVGGGTAATIASHSANPAVWGQDVVQAVAGCQASYGHGATPTGSTTAKQNVGQCVSAIAKQKGQQERAAHSHGKSTGAPTSNPTGRPSVTPTPRSSGAGNGKATSQPTGKPDFVPTPPTTGKPDSVPAPS